MYTICIYYSHVRMRTHTLIFTYVHGCVFMTYTYMFIMIWTWPEGAWMSRTHSFTTMFRNYMSPKIRMNKSQKIPKNMRVPNLDHFANQKPLEFHIYISSYQRLPRVRIFQPHGDDLLSFCPITLGNYVVIFSGWWFGTFFFNFSIYWECHHPNWLLSSLYKYSIHGFIHRRASRARGPHIASTCRSNCQVWNRRTHRSCTLTKGCWAAAPEIPVINGGL